MPPTAPDTPRCVLPKVEDPEHEVLPKYPKDALGNGVDTTIALRVVVNAEGQTEEIIGPSGTNEFARISIEAVRKWRFRPAVVDGKRVETFYRVYIHFNSVLQEVIPRLDIESPQPHAPTPADQDATDIPIYKPGDPGVIQPKAIYTPDPEFTENARKKNEAGDVIFSFIVGVDGRPHNLQLECSTVPDLNVQAAETIKLWRFEPGTKDGQPVAVRMDVSTSFRLY
jgi:TonB family protein